MPTPWDGDEWTKLDKRQRRVELFRFMTHPKMLFFFFFVYILGRLRHLFF